MSRQAKVPRRDRNIPSSSSSDSDVVSDSDSGEKLVGITSWSKLPTRSTEPSSDVQAAALDVGALEYSRPDPVLLSDPGSDVCKVPEPIQLPRHLHSLDEGTDPTLIYQPGPSSGQAVTPMYSNPFCQASSEITSDSTDRLQTTPGLSPEHDEFSLRTILPSRHQMSFDQNTLSRQLDEVFISRDVLSQEDSDSESESNLHEIFVGRRSSVSESSNSSVSSDSSGPVPQEDLSHHEDENLCGVLPDFSSDDRLYHGSPISTSESIISVLSFAQSEKLSGEGFSRLLKLIELHCPQPNQCLQSLSKIVDHFADVKTPMESYFYCNMCLKEVDHITDICDSCEKLGSRVDQVIVLPLIDQVKKFYARPGFLNDIQYRFNRSKCNADNYEDVYDGHIYKEAEKGILSDKNNLAFLWNTDGISPYVSASIEIWPFYLVNIQLSPDKRFKRENLVVAAVFVGKSKPHPNVFLKHVHANVMLLNEGFEVMVPDQPTAITVKACIICGTCDSPAKAMIFNQKYFSGFYSCPKCLSKGEKTAESEDVFVHPFEENIVMRTEDGYEESAQEAAILNQNAPKSRRVAPQGIKGTSFLCLIVDKMITSTSIDTMHCVYLGIMYKLLELWFSKSLRHEDWSLYKVRKVVSNLLLSIKPPHFIKRMPRSLDQKAQLKAYELLLLMYYYLLPVLNGVMKQHYFHNFKLFVGGMSLLNQRSISVDDKNQAKALLNQFVSDYQELYGLRHMTFNMHLVRHMYSVVEALGPAFVTACWGFEDLNGKLCSFIHGSRFAGSQLSSSLFTFLNLPLLVSNLPEGNVKDYCKSLSQKSKRVRLNEKLYNRCYSVGKYIKLVDIPIWMLDSLNAHDYSSVFMFKRLKVQGNIVTSETYTRSKKNCSNYVLYKTDCDDKYGSVKMYVKITTCSCTKKCQCDGEFFAFVSKCNVDIAFKTTNPPAPIKHILCCVESGIVDMVPIKSIVHVCLNLNINGSMYLCLPLNDPEMFN